MLESFSLKFTDGESPIHLLGKGVTVFVGPNNSGKSLVLKELQQSLTVSMPPIGQKIVNDFEIEWPSVEEVRQEIGRWAAIAPPTQGDVARLPGYGNEGNMAMNNVNVNALLNHVESHNNKHYVSASFLAARITRLDGRSRFSLSDDRTTGDLIGIPANFLARLFVNDDLRSQVRAYVHDAFGIYFVIDPLNGGQLRIRLSSDAPLMNEQSLDHAARLFHSRATHIKEASDGMQAYVGIIAAAVSGQYRLIMMDEPEAFLHPPLARKLGRHLTEITNRSNGTLLASTHSADFLMGCMQASHSVRVVRLEYSSGRSRARIVDSDTLDDLLRNPLMRSSNVVSALFHDGVIVTESDNDRAFYAEIYHRITAAESGYPDILFVNGRNKQSIPDIVGPLRRFGIPAAAIFDIDIVKDGGKTWTSYLKAALFPEASHSSSNVQRSEVLRRFEATGKDMKTHGGVAILSSDDRQAASQLFDLLGSYGIFVVRRGELENWLPNLQAEGKKTDWTISILTKLGADSVDPAYVQPAADDVWAFMRNISGWIKSPVRNGTG